MTTEPIEFRVTEENGRRYAVVPLERYTEVLRRAGGADALTVPHEIVARHLTEDVSLIKAWREYLGMTQSGLADKVGVSQAQIAQWEHPTAKPRHASLSRLAAAMGLHVAQLSTDAASEEKTSSRLGATG